MSTYLLPPFEYRVMAFQSQSGPSSAHRPPQQQSFNWPPNSNGGSRQRADAQIPFSTSHPAVDPIEWYPYMQRCRRYFLDVSQHQQQIKAVASFINIRLPCQRHPHPIYSASPPQRPPAFGHMGGGYGAFEENPAESISLIPYIRRLVVTGFDKEEIIEAFFGPDYKQGVNSFWEIERRNYLFAAKSANWLRVKASYEPSPEETIPYMMPLMRVTEEEVMAAERKWSEWLALQDWMVGPRMPGEDVLRRNGNGNGNSYAMRSPGQRIKMEEDL